MANIVPAILASTWSEIEAKVKEIEGANPWVHLDVGDGDFVPVVTWNAPDDLALLPGQIKTEIHLMAEKPEEILPAWVQVADRVVIQIESTDQLDDIVETMRGANTKLALSLLVETPIEDILPYKNKVEIIQLMGIRKAGYQGQELAEETVGRITQLKKAWPEGQIQVDGGINLKNAKQIIEAGASNLVIGSAVWTSGNARGVLRQFKEL